MIFRFRYRKIKLVSGLDIRYLFEQRHKLGQVEELCKARPGTITRPLRRQLQRSNRLAEATGPAVKMAHAELLEPVVLQIPLDSIQLRHGIGDGCAGGKDNTAVMSDLIKIPGFHEHIGTFLGVCSG